MKVNVKDLYTKAKVHTIGQSKAVLIRESGAPIDLKDMENFKEEFKKEFDKFDERYKLENRKDSKIPKRERYTMKDFEKDCNELEEKLSKKYDTLIKIPCPNNFKEMRKLVEKYKVHGITFALHAKTDEIFLTLRDMEF